MPVHAQLFSGCDGWVAFLSQAAIKMRVTTLFFQIKKWQTYAIYHGTRKKIVCENLRAAGATLDTEHSSAETLTRVPNKKMHPIDYGILLFMAILLALFLGKKACDGFLLFGIRHFLHRLTFPFVRAKVGLS